MLRSSDNPNQLSSVDVRMAANDWRAGVSYYPNVPRKRPSPVKKPGHDWYIRQWMASKSMSQADLSRETGWSKSTTSEIVNGITSYYREILNLAADALKVEPYELLMHPDEANRLKSLRRTALEIASDSGAAPAEPVDEGRLRIVR